jgi:hypothetical protein
MVLLVAMLALSGCATRPMGHAGDPGFWHGLLHGLIAPISFVVSLFTDRVRMYAFPNIGRWYDFGFLLGISVWGGGAAARR